MTRALRKFMPPSRRSLLPARSLRFQQLQFRSPPSLTSRKVHQHRAHLSREYFYRPVHGSKLTLNLNSNTFTQAGMPTGVFTSCTCNDNMGYQATTTTGGSLVCATPVNTKTAAPSPTASILIIWDVPPATGQPFYDFYNTPAGFTESHDNDCGNKVGGPSPFWELNDPKQGRIDHIRPATVYRQAPGKLGTLTGVKGNCVYEEDTIGKGTISCDNNVRHNCSPPSSDLANKIEPNNGACGGVKNVRTLVMVHALTLI